MSPIPTDSFVLEFNGRPDHLAFNPSLQKDFIPEPVRFLDAQRYPGKDIGQRALKGQAENDGDNTRSRKKPLQRQVKDDCHHCERGRDIDTCGEYVGQ
jgi:hypothetical protein